MKRLTGLPDDFVLTGTLGQESERVCRMVPPLVTKAIAESVYEKVLKPYKGKHMAVVDFSFGDHAQDFDAHIRSVDSRL